MSKFQLSRFEQHHELPQVGMEGQEKFHAAKILIVGAGGLGCPVALYLVAAGVGTIGLVDQDEVSLSNLQRQILYGNEDVKKLKVERAKERLSALSYNQTINTYPFFLTEDNAEDLIKDYDVVIDASDNHQARLTINSICRKYKKPWVFGALYHFECQLMSFSNKSSDEPCFQCLYAFLNKDSVLPTCKSAGVLSTVPGILGSMQATEALKIILGEEFYSKPELVLMNLMNNSFYKVRIPKNPSCPVCISIKS